MRCMRRQFGTARVLRVHYRNEAGIYHIQDDIQNAVFGRSRASTTSSPELRQLALKHLRDNSLLNQKTMEPEFLDLRLPKLLGATDLDEHFQKIGNHMVRPYLNMCHDFLNESPDFADEMPQFERRSGWVRYVKGRSPQPVEYPPDQAISFDTEVLYEIHPYAVMATAVSNSALYVWLSPWLLGESTDNRHLVPLGPHQQVVVGHNVGFDRKLVKEEYHIEQTSKWYMDTMGLHIAVNGMCNQQRGSYAKLEKLRKEAPQNRKSQQVLNALLAQEPWLKHTTGNGLKDTVKFHLNETMVKTDREFFKVLSREEVIEPQMLQSLIEYCARDSIYTKRLFQVLLPKFLKVNPHPVSFGALRHIASVFLPVSSEWDKYTNTAESLYQEKLELINAKLRELAEEAVAYIDQPNGMEIVSKDPWLSQLDWTVKPIRYTKERAGHPSRPVKNQKMPGKPQWYKELFTGDQMNLTSRTRTTTLLLRLKWSGNPLVWYDKLGWTFWADKSRSDELRRLSLTHVEDKDQMSLFKLPHPDGESGRCTYPFAKFYMSYFENQTITSDNKLANDAIETNLQCSYWLSARTRISSQMPVYQRDKTTDTGLPDNWGIILPRMIPIGAVTRRSVEDTWLTASNAKKNKIGSELKSNVQAPPGYKIIGADVDSEELWIAGVVADSIFKMHGGTAIGWMALEGTKQAKTDLHSKSADILGINRNEAKVFNYGRIYGAGKASAARALRQFNPSMSTAEATQKAAKLYSATKGNRFTSKHFPLKQFWYGGSESIMYNQLELLAEQPRQRTPVLGSGISDALASANLAKSSFMTTRTNWTIQSSGVDYLHLLIAGMHYLTSVYDINARLLITVHDELRYLVKEEDAYRAGLALQVANLWTRALFCQQLGLDCIPHSVGFFSAVDFDNVLRKEVDDPCVTITHPTAIPAGESLSISQLLAKCPSLGEENQTVREEFRMQPCTGRKPVMAQFNDSPVLHQYIAAQIGDKRRCEEIESMLDEKHKLDRKAPKTSGSFARVKPRIPAC